MDTYLAVLFYLFKVNGFTFFNYIIYIMLAKPKTDAICNGDSDVNSPLFVKSNPFIWLAYLTAAKLGCLMATWRLVR